MCFLFEEFSISGFDSIPGFLEIAKMEVVGNEWQEMGIVGEDSLLFENLEPSFKVAVINTEDNSDYIPPKGVKGDFILSSFLTSTMGISYKLKTVK